MGRLQTVALLFIGIGIVSFLRGVVGLGQDAWFLAHASSAQGRVRGVRNEGTGYFACVIEFRANSGREFVIEESRRGRGRRGDQLRNPPCHAGEAVRIVYDPGDPPGTATTTWARFSGSASGVLVGALVGGIGIWLRRTGH